MFLNEFLLGIEVLVHGREFRLKFIFATYTHESIRIRSSTLRLWNEWLCIVAIKALRSMNCDG